MNNLFFAVLILLFSLSANAFSGLQLNIENAHQQGRDEQKYFEDMDASFMTKWNLIIPAINDYQRQNNGLTKICDIGTGTGLMAAKLAEHYTKTVKIIGTDIMASYIALARNKYVLPNLRFDVKSTDDTCIKTSKSGADIVIFSSVLHEAYSYGDNGDSEASLTRAIANAHKALKNKGRIIIRDFVAPADSIRDDNIILKHIKSDIKSAKINGTLRELSCSNFAYDFRAIKNKQNTTRKDIFCEQIEKCDDGFNCYRTNMSTAYEFIFRKDYHDSYEAELNERYGFMSEAKARTLILKAGFRVLSLSTLHNPWISEQRIEGKIILSGLDGKEIVPPAYQIFLVAEKN